MAVDQIRQKTHLQQKKKKDAALEEKRSAGITERAGQTSAYQVNGFIVQVVLQCLLELSDHGLHKLAPKVVVPGIQEAN